ncbi:Myrcene synthase, chloroplastic [Quillaja saponaria]|uniref:Myrcene synthase, chloroplastic n=1 Tax=Quillaja saponaria TaxID=32244 RepID=A0AAD7L353_QUISA|nr:Myrcene synthase, chloroplastic [Quillaja saponaria]
MAVYQLPPLLSNFCPSTKLIPVEIRKFSVVKTHKRCNIHVPVRHFIRNVIANELDDHTTIPSSEYKPSNIWVYDYIQSLDSKYLEETYAKQRDKLKEEVRRIVDNMVNPLHQLELIEVIQRLGLCHHFKDEINRILDDVYKKNAGGKLRNSLEFRLLRQHGYNVSTEVFNSFHNENNNIKEMLSLYEASYLSIEGETILDEAKDFTRKYLKEFVLNINEDDYMSLLVRHALEIPLHWRMHRLEAWWFIDIYERFPNANPFLLDLAKLDFNIIQATHQEDLKLALSWWRTTELENLSFVRDRLMESFFSSVGMAYEPHLGDFRRFFAIITQLITVTDDVYDVRGTLEELKIFTDAVDRWDMNVMDNLPDDLKICFCALSNFENEVASKIGANIIPSMRKVWADYTKVILAEAKWNFNGYKPTLQEHLANTWFSTGIPVTLFQAYFSLANSITKESLDCLEKYPDIIRCSSVIFRLVDDLVTFSDESETPTTVWCYMNETGASEKQAKEKIRFLIEKTWKEMNKYLITNSPLPHAYIEVVMNAARVSLCLYEHGDGFTDQETEIKEKILSLISKPIPFIITE